jgi:hypothetical protein
MTFLFVVTFLVYSVFCWWVVFWDGAEVLEGWKAGLLLGWFDALLTASELRVSVAISWLMALVIGLVTLFSG